MDNPQARLTVVVEVEPGRGSELIYSPSFSGPEETCYPTLLLEGSKSIRLLQPGTLDTQEQCITFDRVLGSDAAQEAEQELLARVQSTLGLVAQGYSVALLLRGRETETPRLVPQLLQMLFEEAQPHSGPDPVLVTLSLVQLSPSGRTQDLLSPGTENLSVLNVSPLGLVVEDASEVEVSDSRAASELYLQAAGDEGRACSLLTVTISCPGPDPPEGPGTQGMWRGALRILQLPRALDCPLLQVLAGRATGEEVEGSLPWIVSRLLEGNNYSGLLLRLDPQGGSLSLLWAALLGAEERRMQVKQVRPILWDGVEEARAHRAGLKSLRSGLLGDNLTDSGLSQLGRALRELQVIKACSQCPGSQPLKRVKAEAVELPKLQDSEERQRCNREQRVLRLQLEALQAEKDNAEQDLVALYELHVQAARAQTRHMLQVLRTWRRLWEEQAVTTEHHHRSLLAGVLQDNINLATQNQELRAQNQQLRQGIH
uniref:uncharacterized protein LOC129514107 n=1 Tax=Nyctereutes procyonoides TaxID=34880 RepID=UPI002443790B|nr:uncharacterized protein LOC129514107 [Nyctereutes procyonoides]